MSPPAVSDTARVPSTAVDVGIVFALSVEADAFERLVEDRREVRGAQFAFSTGVAAGRQIAWCISGVGSAAAAAAARQLIDGHHPRLIVSAGFAGGLDPKLQRGVAVRPNVAVLDHASQPITLAAPSGPTASAPRSSGAAGSSGSHDVSTRAEPRAMYTASTCTPVKPCRGTPRSHL